MKAGQPVTVTITKYSLNGSPTFRQYEIVKTNVGNKSIYSMVRDDARPIAGACTVSLRRLNTSKWKWIAKIQIRIFKHLLQKPKITSP